jgi:hypothetical protein
VLFQRGMTVRGRATDWEQRSPLRCPQKRLGFCPGKKAMDLVVAGLRMREYGTLVQRISGLRNSDCSSANLSSERLAESAISRAILGLWLQG